MRKFFCSLSVKEAVTMLAICILMSNCALAQICDSACIKLSISKKEDSVIFSERYSYRIDIKFNNTCHETCKITYPYIGYKNDDKNIYFEMYRVIDSDTLLVNTTVQDVQYVEMDDEVIEPLDTFKKSCFLFQLYDVEIKGVYLFKGYYSLKSKKTTAKGITDDYMKIVLY